MTTFTTTYYTYDKSQRLTTQYSSAEAHYFTFNQRNMVTQIQDVKSSSPDSMRYFAYNALGERALAIDNGTSYFTYDGPRMLTDKVSANGSTRGRYRHNSSVLDRRGSALEIKLNNGTSSNTFTPAFNHDGSIRYNFQDEATYVKYLYDGAGRQLFQIGGVPTGNALTVSQLGAFTGLGFNLLQTTTEEFYGALGSVLLTLPSMFAFGGGVPKWIRLDAEACNCGGPVTESPVVYELFGHGPTRVRPSRFPEPGEPRRPQEGYAGGNCCKPFHGQAGMIGEEPACDCTGLTIEVSNWPTQAYTDYSYKGSKKADWFGPPQFIIINLVPARRGCYLHQSAEQTFSYDTPRHAQNERRGTERVVGTDRIRLVPNDFSPCKENDPDYDPDEIRDLPGFPGPTEIAVRKFGLVGYAAALTDFVVNKKDERVCPSLQRRWGLRVAFMPEDVDINGEQEYVIQSYLAWID